MIKVRIFQDPRRSLFILIEEFVAFYDKIKKVGGLWGTKLEFHIGSLYFIQSINIQFCTVFTAANIVNL